MQDASIQIEDTPGIQPEVPASSSGAILRAAREQQGLGQAEMANRLRLSIGQIEALESDDFAKLPSGTFLRGFVRNYAKALGLDPINAIAALETSHSSTTIHQSPTLIVPSQNIKFPAQSALLNNRRAKIMFAVALGLLLSLIVWGGSEYIRLYTSQSASVPLQIMETGALKAADTVSVKLPVASTSLPPSASIASSSTSPEIAALPLSGKRAGDAAAKTLAPGMVVLGFHFSGDSWMEITDARDKVLISRHFAAGDTEEMTGRAPLSVVIGNAKVTHMTYNGKEFDLTPYTRLLVARVNLK